MSISLFRSQDMKYVSITMTNESAHDTVRALGTFGKFHVMDLGGNKEAPSKQHLAYKKRIADCVFWEKRLAAFEEVIKGKNIELPFDPTSELRHADVLDALATFLDPIEREYTLSSNFLREQEQHKATAIEKKYVFQVCQNLRLQADLERMGSQSSSSSRSLNGEIELEFKSGYQRAGEEDRYRSLVTGTIPTASIGGFNRMLYRVSRGNAYARTHDIEQQIKDPSSLELTQKSVFYVVVVGRQLLSRVQKMCDLFHATIYNLPETTLPSEFAKALDTIEKEIHDADDVMQTTERNQNQLLSRLSGTFSSCPLRDWQQAVLRERAICQVFMKAHFYLTMIALEGWCPVEDLKGLKQVVRNAVNGTGNPPAAVEIDPATPIRQPDSPPTYFKTNQFTATYQNIVNTYGVPRYKEVNPGLFTVVTFPFLFGVMYGDIGHGVLLTIFALVMIIKEKGLLEQQRRKEMNEIIGMAFGGRYMLFMMGLFGIYNGIMYNDCLSLSLNVWGSTWQSSFNSTTNVTTYASDGTVYPIGVDPAWAHKSNELAFYNSMKMKMSVVLGVTHMTFGIILGALNHIYFKDRLALFLEFVPRILFMLATFGYMCWMIIYKWTVNWDTVGRSPPNLIQTMISMFLSPGSVEKDKMLYEGQGGFQGFLLLVAFFSVPVMLLGKPLAKKHLHAAHAPLREAHQEALRNSLIQDEEKANIIDGVDSSAQVAHSEGAHEEHSLSDELIHNGIHTIEFVLGAVSNTASYLRLWALSLAHAQLAKVFWSKMMSQYGYEGGAFNAFAGFAIWFAATFGVLLCMDVLECFLHALRLHWVEFQNKFFYADGSAYEPFNYDDVESA